MRRELHVRFCEGGGVKLPPATRRAPRKHGGRSVTERSASCTRDEGGPLGLGRQGLGSNHRKLLWHNGWGGERFGKRRDETRQVCAGKANESEPSATCRKRMDAIETKALISGLGEVRETACKLPGRWPAQRRREPSAGSCAERGNLRHDAKGDLQVADPRGAEYRCVVQGRTGS